MKAKYIVVERPDGLEYPFVFSPIIKHDQFASNVIGSGKVVSAGFVNINETPNLIECWGESNSLNLKSRHDIDVKLMEFMFRTLTSFIKD